MGNETLEGKLQDYFREESREFETGDPAEEQKPMAGGTRQNP